MVSATPVRDQVTTGIRQVAAALAIILTAFGATAWAGKLGIVVSLAPQIAIVLTVCGPSIWLAVVWLGQRFTISRAKALAVMAPLVPDEVAKVK